jgi:hypothetical protein
MNLVTRVVGEWQDHLITHAIPINLKTTWR